MVSPKISTTTQMPRLMLTDETWNVLSRVMYLTGRIYNKPEPPITLEGKLFRLKTGGSMARLPLDFGDWNSVFRRFNLLSKKGVMTEIFSFLRFINTSTTDI